MRKTKEDCSKKILNYDWKVQMLLREKGIKTFLTSNGSTFLDYLGHPYGAGEHFFVGNDNWCRTVSKIDWQRDVFIVIKEVIRCFAFPDDVEIKFIDREPLPNAYNAAMIEEIANFILGGYDGSEEYHVYSVTLLTTKLEHR